MPIAECGRLVLAPFTDGLTSRRTSAMAAPSVRALVVSSIGPLFDDWLADAGAALAHDADAFVAVAHTMWNTPDSHASRASRLDWYAREPAPRPWDQYLLERLSPDALRKSPPSRPGEVGRRRD